MLFGAERVYTLAVQGPKWQSWFKGSVLNQRILGTNGEHNIHTLVRYFDPDAERPGLPPDVAALVTKVEADRTVLELVNLSPFDTRRIIVQGGMFGEHGFGRVTFQTRVDKDPVQPDFFARAEPQLARDSVEVNRKFFLVELPPGTGQTLEIETKRFANKPTYAFPWHAVKIPVR